MNKRKIISEAKSYMRKQLSGESSGHDWWHTYRVWKMATHIGKKEKADMFVVELAALLHDIADYKFHGGDETIGPQKASDWLKKQKVPKIIVSHIAEIIKNTSFKGAFVKSKPKTIESMIVQDADRLDAIGAIGIGRTFAFGGARNREMYNPDIKPRMHKSFKAYKNSKSPTINHFYEKLLLLKNLMNTKTGKQIAQNRHKFMELYLDRFFKEWEGKK